MYRIVDKLRSDHYDFQRLIDVMTARIRSLKTGRSSDCRWLIDGMGLIRRQLEVLHGPFEDAFEERLLRRSGPAHRLIEPLLREDHGRFIENSDRFIDCLRGALQGRIIAREQIAEYGETALNNLYRQIAFEERAVFPYAKRLFTPDDWMALDEDVHNRGKNPMTVNALRNECRHLFRCREARPN